MKIAIVHDYLTKIGGAEKVLQVLHKIYPDAPIYTLLYDEKGTKGQFTEGYDIRPSSLQNYPKFIRNRSRLLLSKFPKATESFDFSEFDVVISSSNSFAHGVITTPKTLHITYCYSPMRYAWDWTHKYLEENKIGMGILGLYVRSIISKLRVWDFYASARTNNWIAISKTVAKRIKKYYRKNSTVIYPPVEIDNLLKNSKPAGKYYLIVSRLTQYKNIDIAITAFNKLKLPLFIIGEGADDKRLKSLANDNIKFLGWKNDTERDKYICESRGFIFPGEDDFGLTPVEAMAAGRLVVAYNRGGATETVISGVTGKFFDDASSPNGIIEAVSYVENNYSKFSVENCKNQARKFRTEVFIENFENYVAKRYKEFKK
jgi:glycosyltransferase involved in cell wall biosynthesis